MLDDPSLTLHTAATGDLSPWDTDRLLCAIAHGDPEARVLMAGGIPERQRVLALRRYPRLWARTIDLGVIAGDLDAACCRTGLALPDGDPLRTAATIALLMDRNRGQVEVRQRLWADHPWIGDAAWLSAFGQLAETVVLQGSRREEIRRQIPPGGMPVTALLARPDHRHARGYPRRHAGHA
jgi:hypothetical protein